MSHRETTLRHLWLAGLGLYARVRRTVEHVTGRAPTIEQEAPPAFVTTHKPAKKVTKYSSGSRRAGEHESRRRIAGKGR